MATQHGSRAGPGAQKGEQGSPSKTALPPDQPPAKDLASFYANPSGGDSPTIPSADSADLTGTGHDGASGSVPEAPPGAADTGWDEVDGDFPYGPVQPRTQLPQAGPDARPGELPLGSVVYDSGWEDCSVIALRVVFTAGPANGYLRDWVRELALHPLSPTGVAAGDSE